MSPDVVLQSHGEVEGRETRAGRLRDQLIWSVPVDVNPSVCFMPSELIGMARRQGT